MKLAVIRRECTFGRGGAERYAANLCRALARMGHDVRVLAERCDPDLDPAIAHVPIRVNAATSWSRHRSFHRNCQEAVRELAPDAVLALSRTYPSDAFRVSDPLHAFWMNIRYPNALNRFLQRLNPRHRTILELENAIFRPENTGWIITNSRLSKRIILESFPFPEDRIRVVYNGVDRERFSPGRDGPDPRAENGEVRLLFVGQDFKRKGLAPLLRAFARVRAENPRCRLRVVGRDRAAPYRRLAQRLGVAEAVEFAGPTGSIEQAYRTADLLVFPTLYDPFANVCLEALACGLPVLTTSTNGSSEIIDEPADGYVVDGDAAGLPDRLAECMIRFCRLPGEVRQKMREEAVRKAARYTIEGNARAVAEILAAAPDRR